MLFNLTPLNYQFCTQNYFGSCTYVLTSFIYVTSSTPYNWQNKKHVNFRTLCSNLATGSEPSKSRSFQRLDFTVYTKCSSREAISIWCESLNYKPQQWIVLLLDKHPNTWEQHCSAAEVQRVIYNTIQKTPAVHSLQQNKSLIRHS